MPNRYYEFESYYLHKVLIVFLCISYFAYIIMSFLKDICLGIIGLLIRWYLPVVCSIQIYAVHIWGDELVMTYEWTNHNIILKLTLNCLLIRCIKGLVLNSFFYNVFCFSNEWNVFQIKKKKNVSNNNYRTFSI